MNKVKIESTKTTCQKCEIEYGFDIQSTQEGFKVIKCPHCGHEQMVWIEFRTIVVPVAINPSKRT